MNVAQINLVIETTSYVLQSSLRFTMSLCDAFSLIAKHTLLVLELRAYD